MVQKLKTPLIPEQGIDMSPRDVMESDIDTDFNRSLSHVVGQGPRGSVALRCTSDGRLKVATASSACEIYSVENGNAPNAYDAPNTFEFANAQYVTDIFIETNEATISFRDAAGAWGDDKALPLGVASIDFIHYGIRIQNRVPAAIAAYEITIYY